MDLHGLSPFMIISITNSYDNRNPNPDLMQKSCSLNCIDLHVFTAELEWTPRPDRLLPFFSHTKFMLYEILHFSLMSSFSFGSRKQHPGPAGRLRTSVNSSPTFNRERERVWERERERVRSSRCLDHVASRRGEINSRAILREFCRLARQTTDGLIVSRRQN